MTVGEDSAIVQPHLRFERGVVPRERNANAPPHPGDPLDVTEEEPLPGTSPLWSMPNVILTPHVSGMGPRYWERVVELFSRNLRGWLAGRPLENVVDKRAGY